MNWEYPLLTPGNTIANTASISVTGSIVTESYYSENGAPPVGERKVTVYSNSPEDINDYEYLVDQKDRSGAVARERTSKGGITSVTRVQKIGKPDDAEVSGIAVVRNNLNWRDFLDADEET